MQKKLVCIHQGTWMWEANSCLIAMCPPPPVWWFPPDTYCLPHIHMYRRFSWLLVFDICQQDLYRRRLWNLLSQGNVKSWIYVFKIYFLKGIQHKMSVWHTNGGLSENLSCQNNTFCWPLSLLGWPLSAEYFPPMLSGGRFSTTQISSSISKRKTHKF